MKLTPKSGATIAAATASLILAGATLSTSASAQGAKGKCAGANACKGQSACKTGKTSCKGQNACKGQGVLLMTQADCTKAGFKFTKA